MWEFEQQATKGLLHSLRISEKCQPITKKKTDYIQRADIYQ